MYKTYATESFVRTYNSLPNNEKEWIDSIKKKLKIDPTGKILRYDWFREKKYLNKRLYFILDFESEKILFIAYSSKKNQQKLIQQILLNKKIFFDVLKSL